MSNEVGEYPYKRCTAVESPANTGGEMEYPTITIVNANDPISLEKVIAHEVIYNWFYGILASNERDCPWIDEGFTTFYESLYSKKYFSDNGFLFDYTAGLLSKNKKYSINNLPSYYEKEFAWLYVNSLNTRQRAGKKSEDYSPLNYFIFSYYVPASMLQSLRATIGDSILSL